MLVLEAVVSEGLRTETKVPTSNVYLNTSSAPVPLPLCLGFDLKSLVLCIRFSLHSLHDIYYVL